MLRLKTLIPIVSFPGTVRLEPYQGTPVLTYGVRRCVFNSFDLQDFKFELAAGRFRFDNLANFMIQKGFSNRRFI